MPSTLQFFTSGSGASSCIRVVAGMADLSALQQVLSGSQESGGDGRKELPVAKRRRQLKMYDLAPAQLLNPMQESGVEHCTSQQLWTALSAGNKAAEAFSELCFDEAERRVVGISRMAEVYLHAIERFESSPYTSVLFKDDILGKVKTEIAALKPHLSTLNTKAAIQREAQSVRHLAYLRARGTGADAQTLAEAARHVHAWLQKKDAYLLEGRVQRARAACACCLWCLLSYASCRFAALLSLGAVCCWSSAGGWVVSSALGGQNVGSQLARPLVFSWQDRWFARGQ